MFDLKPSDRWDEQTKLLYNIYMCLASKTSNEAVKISGTSNDIQVKIEQPKNEYKTCKTCNGIHEERWQYAACARKHKKEG